MAFGYITVQYDLHWSYALWYTQYYLHCVIKLVFKRYVLIAWYDYILQILKEPMKSEYRVMCGLKYVLDNLSVTKSWHKLLFWHSILFYNSLDDFQWFKSVL